MNKIFKKFFVLIILCFLVGCSDDLQWFDSIDDAIESGIILEDIKQEDILEKVDLNDETFIILGNYDNENLSLSIANIAKKNDKFAWLHKEKTYTGVKKSSIFWKVEPYSKEKYIVFLSCDYDTILNYFNISEIKSKLYEYKNHYFFIKHE